MCTGNIIVCSMAFGHVNPQREGVTLAIVAHNMRVKYLRTRHALKRQRKAVR
jgi:hypothetical protein